MHQNILTYECMTVGSSFVSHSNIYLNHVQPVSVKKTLDNQVIFC